MSDFGTVVLKIIYKKHSPAGYGGVCFLHQAVYMYSNLMAKLAPRSKKGRGPFLDKPLLYYPLHRNRLTCESGKSGMIG